MNMEKLGTDLRETRSLTQNTADICRCLQLQSPPYTQFNSFNQDCRTDGVDCLIVLVRHIYSQMLPVYYDREEHKDAETKNPILALAWLDIDHEDKAAWADCKQHVLRVLNHPEERLIQTCFATLVKSPLMNETFWSHDAHILVRACLEKSLEADSQWCHANLAVPMAEMNTILVDRRDHPEWSFGKFIRYPFKMFKTSDKRQLTMCAAPSILRVHFKASKDVEPFPFSTLKNFRIPIAGIRGSEPIVEDTTCGYTLIASVSLEQQRIRTYRFLGPEIMRRTYPGKRWSLEDKADSDFMLFYCRSDDAIEDFGTPEMEPLPRESPNLAIVNNALQQDIDHRRARRAAQRQAD